MQALSRIGFTWRVKSTGSAAPATKPTAPRQTMAACRRKCVIVWQAWTVVALGVFNLAAFCARDQDWATPPRVAEGGPAGAWRNRRGRNASGRFRRRHPRLDLAITLEQFQVGFGHCQKCIGTGRRNPTKVCRETDDRHEKIHAQSS